MKMDLKNYDFEKQFQRDKWKLEQCKKNDVKLIYFANKNEAPKYYINEIGGTSNKFEINNDLDINDANKIQKKI